MKSMKLKDIMAGKTPSASYEGFTQSDDYIIAIDITENGATTGETVVGDYVVIETGVKGFSRSLNPEEQTGNYLRAGGSTTKTGTQTTTEITSDRYVGDPAQDFVASFEIVYGTGQDVVVPYIYFNMLTGKGEIGRATILVDNDGSGDAGTKAELSYTLSKVGAKPLPFDWTTDKEKTLDGLENPVEWTELSKIEAIIKEEIKDENIEI